MAQLVANRYANALFDLALENSKIDVFEEEIKLVLDTIKSDKEFLLVLNHPQVSGDEKFDVLEKAFKGKISDEIIGLFSVALRKNRETEIVNMLELFVKKAEDHKGIETAYVTSAIPLTDAQLTSIKEKLSQNLNKQIFIQADVDSSLLGGVRIKVAGHVIDGTIKAKLDDLKSQLLNIHLA